MRSIHGNRRIIRRVACAAALALALVSLRPRPAKADLTLAAVDAIVIFVGDIADTVAKWEKVFGVRGPTISINLNAIKTAIINELRTLRNQELKAKAQMVFDHFAILAARPLSDPTNETLRATTLDTAHETFDWYDVIVTEGTDVTSSYQLAPMFTVLAESIVGLTKMKGELDPKHPAVWAEYDIYLKRAMQDADRLIGTQVAGCWPNYNPGRNRYSVSSVAGTLTAGSVRYNYLKSPLWKKKLAKNAIVAKFSEWGNTIKYCKQYYSGTDPRMVGTYQGLCPLADETFFCTGSTLSSSAPTCNCGSGTGIFPYSQVGIDCLNAMAVATKSVANNLTTGQFGSNGVVKVLRNGMEKILMVGGGDDRWSNNTIPTNGMITDPWLDESACGPFGPWSYPANP